MTKKPNLYILDDDPQYADLLAEVARNAGWEVKTEKSSTAFLALDYANTGILVLDLIMPEVDGIEVLSALAEKKSELILVLLSGSDPRILHAAQHLAKALKLNIFETLTKPVSIQAFIDVLSKAEAEIDFDK